MERGMGQPLLFLCIAAAVLVLAVVKTDAQQPLDVNPDEPLTLNVLRKGTEHVKCPENAIKVLELNFPWPKVRCMCVNGTFGEDCTERIASESQVTTIGIITLPEPVRLVEPNIKHDLRGKLPVGTTNVLVQVVVRARFAGNTKTNNCGLRLCVTGTGSRCVETYDTYPGAESTYLRNTAFPIVPVDTNNPTLIWDWEIFQFGCYDVNTTEVIVLSAFRGAGALPAHP